MQRNGKSVAFCVRLPLVVGDALIDAQRPGLTYRQIAQQAIIDYAHKLEQLANADTEKAA